MSQNVQARSSTTMSSGLASCMPSRWYAARHCRCHAASRQPACRSGCKWWRRRVARQTFSPARRRWKIFLACAARPRSTRGRRHRPAKTDSAGTSLEVAAIWALVNGARVAIIAEENQRAATGATTGKRRMSGKLRVRVDQDKCQGHARCKSLAPELFELDGFGNAREIGDGTVPKGLEDKAWLAQTNCPEIAIEVIEE